MWDTLKILASYQKLAQTFFGVTVGIFILKTAQSYLRLRHIPGPRSAAFTNFVRRSWVIAGDLHQTHADLHKKYGTVVRIGPNAILISQPAAIDKIYGFKAKFIKVRHKCHISYQIMHLSFMSYCTV